MLETGNNRSGNRKAKMTGEGSRSLFALNDLSDARWFLILIVLYLVLSVSVCILNPLFESTDEIRHYRFIRILVTERRLPIQGEEPLRAQSHHPPLY